MIVKGLKRNVRLTFDEIRVSVGDDSWKITIRKMISFCKIT